MATEAATTAAQTSTTGITSFVDPFLTDLNAAVAESVRVATGEIENALHQKLVSCGDKKKQARQLNAVAKGSSAYMARIQRAFEKNFDKFEMYVRRNIVMIPSDVAVRVEQLHHQQCQLATNKTTHASETNQHDETDGDDAEYSHLTPSQRRERQLEDDLQKLRLQIRQLELDTQCMALEQSALETQAQRFKHVAAQLDFLEQLPQATISPLTRTVDHVAALQQSMVKMESVQCTVEDDTRAFKRQKMETRDSYRNLRQRFLARTATVAFASLDDFETLNAALGGGASSSF